MENRILIFGRGFIGERLRQEFACAITEKRIASFKDIESELKRHSPRIIINCIGHTGKRNVDDCELDKDKAIFANATVPLMLAEVAIRHKIRLIHISSGCIYHYDYGKDKPLKEKDMPDFFDLYYSRTKIYSEIALLALADKFDILIPRIRIPLDNRPHPKNILTKLIDYKKVIELPNSITYIPDFIKALKHLIRMKARGIYNVVNKGALKYQELLDIYKKYVPNLRYKVVPFKRMKLTRTNLILSTEKLEGTGFKVRDIHGALEECIKEYLQH